MCVMFMDGRESRVGHVPGLVRFTIEMAAMAAQYVDSHNYNGSLMVAHLFMLNKKQSARARATLLSHPESFSINQEFCADN